MLSYLFSKLNKITENRKERLNRINRKPYLAPRREEPTQPSRPTRAAASSSSSRASKLLGGMPPSQPGEPPRHLPAWSLPAPPLHAWTRPEAPPDPFPLSSAISSPSFARSRRGRRDHRALELKPASPPCSSSSNSSSSRSWSPNSLQSRRHRLQLLAGPASSPSLIRRR